MKKHPTPCFVRSWNVDETSEVFGRSCVITVGYWGFGGESEWPTITATFPKFQPVKHSYTIGFPLVCNYYDNHKSPLKIYNTIPEGEKYLTVWGHGPKSGGCGKVMPFVTEGSFWSKLNEIADKRDIKIYSFYCPKDCETSIILETLDIKCL
eukprot:UN31453